MKSLNGLMGLGVVATILLGVFYAGVVMLFVFILPIPITKAQYVEMVDGSTYELYDYEEGDIFLNVRFIENGFLKEEEFDKGIVKIKLNDNDEKAKITIKKEKKVEPSSFEKVFFLKGFVDAEERTSSVELSLSSDEIK